MSRRSTPCTQADITRLIKAALAAGVGMDKIAGVKLTCEGAFLLFGETKIIGSAMNEWDEVLDDKSPPLT